MLKQRNANQAYSVLHVDDHEIVRVGVRTAINRIPNFDLIDEDISDGNRAMIMLSRYQPDVAILDVDLPCANGIEVARHIMLTKLPTKIILLSNTISAYTFEECLSLNVMGFLTKTTSLSELRPCLNHVVEDKQYISTDCLNARNEFSSVTSSVGQKLQEILSKSEIKVLKLIAIGKSTPQIAEEICNSARTIDSHRYKMSQKLQLKGKHGLLSFAFQNKSVILSLPVTP